MASRDNAVKKAARELGSGPFERLSNLIYGQLPIGMDDREAKRIAASVAADCAEMIVRQLSWIADGIHPTIKTQRRDC